MFRTKRSDGTTRLEGGALAAYPVGAIYISLVNTDPGVLFGGTWVPFGGGHTLVGLTLSDADFDTAGETGGEKTHTLTKAEIPSHVHNGGSLTTTNAGGHAHTLKLSPTDGSHQGTGRFGAFGDRIDSTSNVVNNDGSHAHNVTGETGSGSPDGLNGNPHNNMPPYVVVYMWRRSA